MNKEQLYAYTLQPSLFCMDTGDSARKRNTYPYFSAGPNIKVYAHRQVLEWSLGRTLEPGEVCRHTCDNRWCVNPTHLEVGHQVDNVRDAVSRGRHSKPPTHYGERNPASKLKASDIPQIREMRRRGEKATSIAEKYGVNKSAINNILRGKTWGHVP